MFELDRDSYRAGNITQQGMTFLIGGREESEIGALSFYRRPGLRVRGRQAGRGRGGHVALSRASAGPHLFHRMASHAQQPASSLEVGRWEIFLPMVEAGQGGGCE